MRTQKTEYFATQCIKGLKAIQALLSKAGSDFVIRHLLLAIYSFVTDTTKRSIFVFRVTASFDAKAIILPMFVAVQDLEFVQSAMSDMN